MSKTLTISDEKYQKIEALARLREFENAEQFLERDEQLDEHIVERQKELKRRQKLGQEIMAFQQRMLEKYGVMPDSAELIREDREER